MDYRQIVVQIVALLVAITVHEMAHAWMAHRLGDTTPHQHGRLSFSPLAHIDLFGTIIFPLLMVFAGAPPLGWAKPVPVNPANFRRPLRDMGLVSLAGPASNLVTAVVAAVVLRLVFVGAGGYHPNPGLAGGAVGGPVFFFLLYCVIINVLLAVFNLIPIPPLDGGHYLETIVPWRFAQTLKQIEPYGMFIILGLLWLGLLDRIIRPIQGLVVGLLLP